MTTAMERPSRSFCQRFMLSGGGGTGGDAVFDLRSGAGVFGAPDGWFGTVFGRASSVSGNS